MKSLLIFTAAFLLLSLYGCYTQIGVKDEYGNEYSGSGQEQNSTYVDQGAYYGYEDYSLGCERRFGFSYYYPSFFPSEEFAFTSSSMWSFDYQPGFSSGYGGYGYGGYGYPEYSGSYYHQSYYRYPQAYARYIYPTNSAVQGSTGGGAVPSTDGGQGSRDIGSSRYDIPAGGNVDLPRGQALQGSPRVVVPNTPTQTSTDNSGNTGSQRSSSATPAKTGKRGTGKRSGGSRTIGNTKPATLPSTAPNVRVPDQSPSQTPVTIPQNTGQTSSSPAQSQPPPTPPPANSNDRKAGTNRDNPPPH